MAEHKISVVEFRSTIVDKFTWRASCSCGKYTSKFCGSPGQAEHAGRAHADAKNGVRR